MASSTAALLAGALLVSSPSPQRAPAAWPPLPYPELAHKERAVREHLEEERARLDRLLASDETTTPQLVDALTEVGGLYLVYDLAAPAAACLSRAIELAPNRFRALYLLGALEQVEGELEESERILERAHALRPGDVPTRLRLGEVALALGAPAEAEGHYRAVLDADPENAAARFGLGRALAERDDFSAAIEQLEQAVRLQPDATVIHHHLGMAYRALGRRDEARRHLALNTGVAVRFEDPVVDRLAALGRGSAIHYGAGLKARQEGDLEAAIREFEAAIRARPEYATARFNLAMTLLETGQVERAEHELETVLETDPDRRDALFNLGLIAADQGRADEAARRFEQVLALDPTDREARAQWLQSSASSAIASEQHERAVELLREVVEMDPAAVAPRETLARELAGLGRFGEAAAEFGRLVELQPDRVEVHFSRSMALILGGRYVEAKAALEESVARLPESIALQHALARLLATCPEDAVRDGDRALALADRVLRASLSIDHAETVAMALAELGRFEDAADLQRQVIEQARARFGSAEPALSARLAAYQAHRKVRAPWLDGGR